MTRKVRRSKKPKRGRSAAYGQKRGGENSPRVTYELRSTTDEQMQALSDVIASHAPRHAIRGPQNRNVVLNRSARENKQVTSSFLDFFGKNKGSYSPSVQKVLNLPTKGTRMHNIFGCEDDNNQYPIVRIDPTRGTPNRKTTRANTRPTKSWLFRKKTNTSGGGSGDDDEYEDDDDDVYNDECVYFTDPRARRDLLENLALQRRVDCAKIITPRQAQSNCWFNTMFVMFFISDKGRKFFQYFRAMMILGVRGSLLDMRVSGSLEKAIETLDEQTTEGNTMVLRPDMRRAFFYLNKAIDACLNGDEYAYTLNTNDIILQIHNAVVQTNPQYAARVTNVGALGNPFVYYMTLMNFLSDKTIRVMQFHIHAEKDDLRYLDDLYDDIRYETKREGGPPHVILVSLSKQNEENNLLSGGDAHLDILECDNGVQYKLDAALVRSTNTMHWTCLLTCNGGGYAYDGASFTKLVPFNWKKKVLNVEASYYFESTSVEYEYDFHYDTHTLVYYRHA